MRAVFLDYDTVSTGDLDKAELLAVMPGLEFHGSTEDAAAAARISDAEVILLNKFVMSRRHFQNAPCLRLIAVAGTGTDNVDLAAAREYGVGVCNVCGYCTQSVTQQVWALLLSLTQRLRNYTVLAQDGSWVADETSTVLAFPIRELAGRTFAVVGWGELGRASARIAEAFGMQVSIANRRGEAPLQGRIDFDVLLGMADVLSLHCPLTPATRGLIGARELALMKPTALLINTARGGLVDGAALATALRSGRLAGAGIDVLQQEPPIDGDPLLSTDIPNLLLTPHIAWAAREARQRCLFEMAANVRDFVHGGRRSRVA